LWLPTPRPFSGWAASRQPAPARKLSDRLADGDIERKKAEDEQFKRENAANFAREERARKIAFMDNMPENTPAGKVFVNQTQYEVCHCTLGTH
jgi:hypothetical protein